MVNIWYDVVNDEILGVARMISKAQKTDVTITTPTETVEVRYEEEKTEREEGNQSQASESR